MSDISNIYSKAGAVYDSSILKKKDTVDSDNKTESASKSKIPGKTVGNPTLSDKASEYYKELRSKFHNMEFILVSEDEKENAKKNAASYAKGGKMVVLIDEEKLEKMATDSAYREQYESIIEKAADNLTQFAESVKATGANVKGYGMQVNDDGSTSLFAVLEKSTKAQAERIEKKREENRAEKKAENKEKAKERLKEHIENAKEARNSKAESKKDNSDDIVVTANSWEELLKKIEDQVQLDRSDVVITEAEKSIGQNIDFSA